MTIFKYLRENLGFESTAGFAAAWRALPTKDKDDLKRYAVEEMIVMGVAIEEDASA